ncbi:MAG: MFS transporter [Spirochaetia bacterium]|jgi:MFS family permease
MARSAKDSTAADPVALGEPRTAAPRGTGWLFAGLFLLYMFDYIDREVVSSLIPFLKASVSAGGLGLSDTQAGSLASAVYWSIVAFTFPVSILVDRWSRKRSVGIMVMLWSIATGLAAFIKSFPQLFLTRLGVGVGEAGYAPGGTAMLSAMYPIEKRSRMMGLWNASIPLGSAIGVGLGGLIATQWGWKHAFGLVAIPGFIIGVLFFFLARDYRTVKLERPATETRVARRMRVREIVRDFLHTPSLLLTYVAFAGNTFLTSAYLIWLPSYFVRTQGMPAGRAGLKASSIMLLAIIGAPLGGFLVDAWRKKHAPARPLFAGLSSILAAGIWLLAFGVFSGTGQYIVMMLAATCTLLYLSGASAVTQDVVHPGLWAISYAICVIVQNLLGSSTGPIIVGAISDKYGLPVAMLIVPLASVIAGMLFLLAANFYRRDLEKVDKVVVEMER